MSITDSERLSISELAALAAPNNKKEAETAYLGYINSGQVASEKEAQLPVLGVHRFKLKGPFSGHMNGPQPFQRDASCSLLADRGRLKTATKPKTHSPAPPVQYITRSEARKIAQMEHVAGRWSAKAWEWCEGQPEPLPEPLPAKGIGKPLGYLRSKEIAQLPEFMGKTYKQRNTTKKPQPVDTLLNKWGYYGFPQAISNPEGQGFDVALLRLELAGRFDEEATPQSQASHMHRIK